MYPVPNIQQLFDDHLFNAINDTWGNGAPGGNWISDPDNNVKNKYAVVREYRTLDSVEVMELVKGRTQSNLGCVIITTTRLRNTPLNPIGKKYGGRMEVLIYNCSLNIRQSQIGGERITYEMNRDVAQAIIDNPFHIDRHVLPVDLQVSESDFTTTEMDAMRMSVVVPNFIYYRDQN